MPKIFSFLGIFIPSLAIVFGFTLAIISVRALLDSSKTLECFCPSCPDFDLSHKGVSKLGLIKVEVAGAVKKPGIYQLEIGQRTADLLASAGGFLKEADKFYVAKNLNLASELKNQDKVYIPFANEIDEKDVSPSIGLVSINQASEIELQNLSGIGEVRAKEIVSNRPYNSLEELVGKSVLSESVFANLKTQLSL